MQVIVVNGKTMVPITARVGERIVLHVFNRLSAPISLHWHGMLQQGTITMDGVDGTTQRPVQPNGAVGSCWGLRSAPARHLAS